MKNMSLLIATLMVFTSLSASADCLEKYKYERRSISERMTEELNGEDGGAVVFVPFIGAIAAIQKLVGNSQSDQRVISLINDANSGDGLVLGQFARQLNVSLDEAADFVRTVNNTGQICTDHLFTLEEVIALAKSM